MNSFIHTPLMQQISSHIILILCITFINGLLLFAIIALILGRFKQTPANHKHLIWLFLLFSFIAIPLISIMIPSIDVHHKALPGVENLAVANYTALSDIDSRLSTTSSQYTNTQDMDGKLLIPDATVVRHIMSQHWQTAVIVIWLTGVFLSMIRILVGRIGLWRLMHGASNLNHAPFSSLVNALSKRLGISKKVQVLGNRQCIAPFTCFLLKPVILLPARAVTWPEDRIRAVLLHELTHIKRMDFVFRVVARFLCAFFWFIPPVWVTYHRMQIEEEKACDASVIRCGVKASDYAGHIIDIARSTRGMVLLSMLQLFFGHHSTLEPRIRNILRLSHRKENHNWRVLMRILLICLACLLLLQFVNPVTARDNGIFEREAPVELLYGRWIDNHVYEHYEKIGVFNWPKKIVVDEDGTMCLYNGISDPELPHVGETNLYTVTENRIDIKGFAHYKLILDCSYSGTIWFTLIRIDPSKTILEFIYSDKDYPSNIDTDDFAYSLFDKT